MYISDNPIDGEVSYVSTLLQLEPNSDDVSLGAEEGSQSYWAYNLSQDYIQPFQKKINKNTQTSLFGIVDDVLYYINHRCRSRNVGDKLSVKMIKSTHGGS